jgi:hypothetical protein
MVASITELNLKNFWSYLVFLPHAVRSHRQASKAEGMISIQVRSEGILVQRTLTVWQSARDMVNFVKAGPHRNAMASFSRHANPSFTCHFEVDEVPSWEDALNRLRKDGRTIYDRAPKN